LTFYNLIVEGTRTTVQAVNVAVNNNLTINSGAYYDLSTYSLTVDGTVANNGALIQTKNAPSGSTTEFLHIRNAANSADKYFGVYITPAANMGATTVMVYGNQASCSSNPADQLARRCFDIAPTSPQNATLRLYYTETERNGQAANALKLWHYASGWSQVGTGYTYSEAGTTCTSGTPAGSACWMQALNVSSYSPFGIGSGGNPTRVTVRSLTATSQTTPWIPVAVIALMLGAGTLLFLRRRK
jgi:LPXTG-motif cell wall-anchored protein